MPRAAKEVKRPAHRPSKPINWELVDELLLSGCLGTEIAPHFDMHPHTFYDRVELEYGITFTEYSSEKKAKGESILRHTQFKKAIGEIDKGDNALLIWLGKQRLQQRELAEVSVDPATTKAFGEMMNQLKSMQEARAIESDKKPEEKKYTSEFN
jgi:hypothetical protein